MERINRLLFIGAVFDRVLYGVTQARMTVLLLIVLFVFNGCTALMEAQQRREKRILEERNINSLMLRPSKAIIEIGPDALFSASDHYTLTFARRFAGAPQNSHTVDERETFARSALGYMESLYEAMNRLFGFQPKHKIHVTIARPLPREQTPCDNDHKLPLWNSEWTDM